MYRYLTPESYSRISNKLIPIILPSNVIFVLALYAAKELLLSYDVGVFWVLMRVLACGGLGMLTWEAFTGKLMKNGNIEVRVRESSTSCLDP